MVDIRGTGKLFLSIPISYQTYCLAGQTMKKHEV